MVLSDDERRRLAEMERMLALDDPGFATSISITRARRRRWVVGAVAFVLGAVVLIAGLVTTAANAPTGVLIGGVGLLIMLWAALAMLFRRRRRR